MNLTQPMKRAIEVCRKGIAAGESPFGAVIVDRGGNVVCEAHNVVRSTTDITAHAEIHLIRSACRTLGRIDLTGYTLVSTCEPCPMCASAIHWARFDAVAYGATIADAQSAGFAELTVSITEIYSSGKSPVRILPRVLPEECAGLFTEWRNGPNPTPY